MFKKDRIYKFYIDPAHSWIAVKRKELKELNILDKITSYSYQKGNTVYLEEDQDATILTNRLKELDITYSFTEKYHNRTSPIRSYDHFKSQEMEVEVEVQKSKPYMFK